MLSVIAITLAFRSLANSMAFNVRMEYLGKTDTDEAVLRANMDHLFKSLTDTGGIQQKTLPRIIFR